MSTLPECLFCGDTADPEVPSLVFYCSACWRGEAPGVKRRMESDRASGKSVAEILEGAIELAMAAEMGETGLAALENRIVAVLMTTYSAEAKGEHPDVVMVLCFQLGLQLAQASPRAAAECLEALQRMGARLGGIPLDLFQQRDRAEALGVLVKLGLRR